MKIELEEKDVKSIAEEVAQCLKAWQPQQCSIQSDDRVFTKQQLSKYIGLSVQWISNNKHRLPHYNIGDKPLYRKAEIDAWLETYRVLTPDTVVRREVNVVEINRKPSRRKSTASFRDQKALRAAS